MTTAELQHVSQLIAADALQKGAAMLQRGSVVRIRPEWCDRPEEAARAFVCIDAPEKGRVSISPIDWPYFIVPVETVETRMLEVQR
jgi:hypothetical protein